MEKEKEKSAKVGLGDLAANSYNGFSSFNRETCYCVYIFFLFSFLSQNMEISNMLNIYTILELRSQFHKLQKK